MNYLDDMMDFPMAVNCTKLENMICGVHPAVKSWDRCLAHLLDDACTDGRLQMLWQGAFEEMMNECDNLPQ